MCVERMALTPALWEQTISGLTCTSYTNLQVVGRFEWLRVAHADFGRLIDWIEDVQEREFNERHDAESNASVFAGAVTRCACGHKENCVLKCRLGKTVRTWGMKRRCTRADARRVPPPRSPFPQPCDVCQLYIAVWRCMECSHHFCRRCWAQHGHEDGWLLTFRDQHGNTLHVDDREPL